MEALKLFYLLRKLLTIWVNGQRALKTTNIAKPKKIVTASQTRPDNTAAYAVGDVVGTSPAAVGVLENVADANGGSGKILKLKVAKSGAGTTNAKFRLSVFNVSPDAVADGDPFPFAFADFATLQFNVDFTLEAYGTGSDCAVAVTDGIKYFVCDAGSKNLFYALTATAAYAPDSREEFVVEAVIELD